MKKLNKIIINGADSRFCFFLKKNLGKKNAIFVKKKKMNILKYSNLLNYLKNQKPKILIHVAALSRPMTIHEKNVNLSIETNIIGTANVVRACQELNIKLIYFSTNYVYPCIKGNYKETDPLKPINNYALTKLGGECSVMMLKNSLILRLSMTDYPFAYDKAYKNAYSSFIYNKDFAKILPYLLKEKGVINIGGKRQTIYDFAKKTNKKIKPMLISKKNKFPLDSSLNVSKFIKILKKLNKYNEFKKTIFS